MTTTDTESPIDRLTLLGQYVGRRAGQLQAMYQQDHPQAVATLARLRRAVPTSARQLDPDSWDVFADMPAELLGEGDQPGHAEFAAVAALALFGVHQQSRRDAGMHRAGRAHTPGRAIGQLAQVAGGPGVERRFRALTRSADVAAALQHLRSLVTQLRGARIPMDYAALAGDLYYLQYPTGLHVVRMRWTRDFHRPHTPPDGGEESVAPETGEEQ